MPTLSLAMIVRNEGSTIERVLACAKPFCDEMIVVDTGSTDDTVAKATAMGAALHHFTWIDDFAAARNFAFAQCTGDWIIWLDGDDTVSPDAQARIQELKRSTLDPSLDAVYLRYDYPPFLQWRERIVRRALFGHGLEWREPIHEVIHGIDLQRARFIDTITITHAPPPERQAAKKDRNLNILRRHHQRGANDERTLYMYAVECLHSLERDEAGPVLDAFFAMAQQPTYRYEVACKMHDFLMHFKEPRRALEALSKAIVEDPARAEAYYRLGKHLLEQTDQPAAAIALLTVASQMPVPREGIPEMAAYTHGPWALLCRAHFRLENHEAAQAAAFKALQHEPPNREWLQALAQANLARCNDPLPEAWQEWTAGNLKRQVPRWNLMRLLEENGFSAAQIATAMRAASRG